MIDLHTHVLPGIDDGPPDVAGSLAMGRAAAAAGVRTLVATPHVSWDHPGNTAAVVRERVQAVNAAFAESGVPVDVRTGGEVTITRAADLPDEELAALRLGGGPWLLVECPLTPAAAGIEPVLHHLQVRGHRVVLAHPERSPAMQRDPDLLERLVRAGMLSSITAGALVGRFGRTVAAFAHELVQRDLVHNVTSDAHDAVRRPPGMLAALTEAERALPGLLERAAWLTEEVPGAILAGAPIPPPPGPPPQARRRRRLRGLRRA